VVAGLASGTARDGSPVNGIFPNVRVDSPLNARGLPYELREDAAHLPRYTGNYRAFKNALGERALEDERRLLYVAATRARQLLVLTAAWWYQGSDKRAKGPSPFWREAAEHPLVDVLVQAGEPPNSPLAERLAGRRDWPGPARRADEVADQLFPEGWAGAVELARRDPEAIAARLGPGERDAYQAALAAQRHLVELRHPPVTTGPPEAPRVLPVSRVLTYARCPRAFYWTVVRPLPVRPRQSARIGTTVHRLLERQALRPLDLVEPAGDDWAPPSTADPGLVARARRNFDASRFAAMAAPEPEVPIALRSGQWLLRGRIDAVYRTPEGVELVDYKTGAEVGGGPGTLDQLALYALALREAGRLGHGTCRVTYCYLGGDAPSESSRLLDGAALDEQAELLAATLAGIEAGGDPAGSRACEQPWCEACGRS
jgi:DNA helicase-2/ATP-dependent DNA helicase PcrA